MSIWDNLIDLNNYMSKVIKKNRGLYMSEMEQIFNIPLLNNDVFNEANAEVIQLYRKFADWLFDEND